MSCGARCIHGLLIARGSAKYTFDNPGTNGYGDMSGSTQQPVTTDNWRDAMVWCNALTEYYNANGGSPTLACVYCTTTGYTTPIRSCDNGPATTAPGTEDNPCINPAAKGFRLPLSNEYEYAARYIGTTNGGITAAISMSGYYWTPGNYASGATADYTNNAPTFAVAVFKNYGSTTTNHTGVTTTAVVKSKKANALGLYDMSGNTAEWCFDWHPRFVENGFVVFDKSRLWRGGSFQFSAGGMQVGIVGFSLPYSSSIEGVGGELRHRLPRCEE